MFLVMNCVLGVPCILYPRPLFELGVVDALLWYRPLSCGACKAQRKAGRLGLRSCCNLDSGAATLASYAVLHLTWLIERQADRERFIVGCVREDRKYMSIF